MITVSFAGFVVGFLFLGLLFFVVLWLFYDRRDKNYYDRQRQCHVHHCVKCGQLYSSRETADAAACPNCEFKNAPLKF